MKILLINPNTTESMTRKAELAAKKVCRSDTQIIATNSKVGPSSIEGFYDVACCLPGLLKEASRFSSIDAVVVACFDDTGLDALRCQLNVPVIGIGEAAYHAASMVAYKFSVVTTLSRSIAGITDNLNRYGLKAKCVSVRATDIPVLKLEEKDTETLEILRAEIATAVEVDHAEAVVLGCAGMADLMSELSKEFGIPVIDGISCAIGFAEALVSAGISTSKLRTYAYPPDKLLDIS